MENAGSIREGDLMHGDVAQASHPLAQSNGALSVARTRVLGYQTLIGKTLGHPSDVRPSRAPQPASSYGRCQQVNPCVRLTKQTIPRAAA